MAGTDGARFHAVLFDFHNTLFHFLSDATWLLAGADACGMPMTAPRAQALAVRIDDARRLPDVVALEREQDLSPRSHRRAVATWLRLAGLPGPLADALYEQLVAPASWQPFADAAPVLRELRRAGIAVGVLSNTGWDLRDTFTHHGLQQYVSEFTLSCELGMRKPDSSIFRHACDALGADRRLTLMVGDNPGTDGGCVTAGLSCYLLALPCDDVQRGLSAVLRLVGVTADLAALPVAASTRDSLPSCGNLLTWLALVRFLSGVSPRTFYFLVTPEVSSDCDFSPAAIVPRV
jgi:HAD superfamily hydrolase (TIGR01549 family)